MTNAVPIITGGRFSIGNATIALEIINRSTSSMTPGTSFVSNTITAPIPTPNNPSGGEVNSAQTVMRTATTTVCQKYSGL